MLKRIAILFASLAVPCAAFTSLPSSSSSSSSCWLLHLNGILKTKAAFITIPTTTKSNLNHRLFSSTNDNDDNKEDLFDYFDPRLSPHEYPKGINDNASSSSSSSSSNQSYKEKEAEEEDRLNPFGTSNSNNNNPSSSSSSAAEVDVFDPRISPHEYPNGLPDQVGVASTTTPQTNKQLEQSFTTTNGTPSSSSVSLQQSNQDLFDPTLSPHAYPNGTPDTIGHVTTTTTISSTTTTTTTTKIGILLIDHGSKRSKSNLHLESLARVYQQQYSTGNGNGNEDYIVKAAHMEIASPTIEEGMRMLIDKGVGKIICHPYFLSPGKHATQDVPKLVQDAISSIDMPHIPVITTEPLGTKLDVLVSVINALVEESLQTLEGGGEGEDDEREMGDMGFGMEKKKEWELGGFFGDVKRMLEEEE